VDFDKYEDSNLANTPSRAAGPGPGTSSSTARYAASDQPNDVPPVFAAVNDSTVVGASLSRDRRLGALYTARRTGAYSLSIGQLTGDSGADFQAGQPGGRQDRQA